MVSGISFLPQTPPPVLLYGLQSLIFLGPLWFFTTRKYGSTWKDFGYKRINFNHCLKLIGAGLLIYFTIASFLSELQKAYHFEIPGFGEQESHIPLFGDHLGGLILGGIIMIGVAPIVEETFFRGYLHQLIRKYRGTRWATILSAAIFALFHMELQVFIPLFILGVLFSLLVERSKSIWPAVGFHMLNNSIAFTAQIALHFEWITLPS